MLQRIQTVFLIITIVGMGVFLGFPIWSKIAPAGTENAQLTATKLIHQTNAVQSQVQPIYYFVAIVSAYAIISFKNRTLQSALCAVNSLLMTVMIGLVIYYTFYTTSKLFDEGNPGNYEIGFYGLMASMLANVFANRFIRKDEKAVQQSNRFR